MREKVLIIGSRSDLAKAFMASTKKFIFIKINSDSLDLKNPNLDILSKLRFEHLVFFSGINKPKNFHHYSDQEIIDHFNINFISITLLIKRLMPNFIKKKQKNRLIFVTSLYSKLGRSGRLPYSLSKFALNGLSKNIAVEYGKYNITSNCVSPGFVNTKLTRKNLSKNKLKKIKLFTPSRSLVKKNEIASVINFLLSKDSEGINGQELVVDGGISSNGGFGE